MPSDDPGSLSAADSGRVAAYIFDAFYSPGAQGRIQPLRRDLSRLTVRQYRNATADLIASFRPAPPPIGPERGLKAGYYKTRRFNQNDRVLERRSTPRSRSTSPTRARSATRSTRTSSRSAGKAR